MAQRRMISIKVIDTDMFLDMPSTSRLLYYDLCLRADDDGFVANFKKIIRMTGAQDDDLKILITKSFVIPFETGVCVIRHWRIHNYIQKDRYQKTLYSEEFNGLTLSENGEYTKCIQNVSSLDAQVRLGKDRLGKSKDSNKPTKKEYADTVTLTDDEYQKLIDKHGENATKRMIEMLDNYKGANGKKYASDYKAILNWVVDKYAKENPKNTTKPAFDEYAGL